MCMSCEDESKKHDITIFAMFTYFSNNNNLCFFMLD